MISSHLDLMIFALNHKLDLFVYSCHFAFFLDIECLKLSIETQDLVISSFELRIKLACVLTDTRNRLMSCQVAFKFLILDYFVKNI